MKHLPAILLLPIFLVCCTTHPSGNTPSSNKNTSITTTLTAAYTKGKAANQGHRFDEALHIIEDALNALPSDIEGIFDDMQGLNTSVYPYPNTNK